MFTPVGKLWTRSQKLAYTLLNKLSTRNEPLLMPGDRVSPEIKLCIRVSCLRYLLHTMPFVFSFFTCNRNCISFDILCLWHPIGCTGFPQQWSSDVHGSLLRLSPGRAGTCAYWSAADQKGKGKNKILSPGTLIFQCWSPQPVKSSSDPCWTLTLIKWLKQRQDKHGLIVMIYQCGYSWFILIF